MNTLHRKISSNQYFQNDAAIIDDFRVMFGTFRFVVLDTVRSTRLISGMYDLHLEMEYEAWKVPELKEFLQDRGVTCHLYNKAHLVRLFQLATELNLEVIGRKGEFIM